jgi:hypothetical protein
MNELIENLTEMSAYPGLLGHLLALFGGGTQKGADCYNGCSTNARMKNTLFGEEY